MLLNILHKCLLSPLTKVVIISEPSNFFNIIFVNDEKIFFMLNNANLFGCFNFSLYLCIINQSNKIKYVSKKLFKFIKKVSYLLFRLSWLINANETFRRRRHNHLFYLFSTV